jgi:hypothetical protein
VKVGDWPRRYEALEAATYAEGSDGQDYNDVHHPACGTCGSDERGCTPYECRSMWR